MNHYSDCMLLCDWLDSAALPASVQGALERCLDELERYDRGMGRNYPEGEWPPLEARKPITETVQVNRKLSASELRARADALLEEAMKGVFLDDMHRTLALYRAASDAWVRAVIEERGER